MKKETVKVIVKRVPGKFMDVELFLPEASVNPGMIMCWARVGQHGEAGCDYYHSLRNPQGLREEADARELIRAYEKNYGVKCVRVKRQSAKQRLAAWVR